LRTVSRRTDFRSPPASPDGRSVHVDG
jgi:hypothetical protein